MPFGHLGITEQPLPKGGILESDSTMEHESILDMMQIIIDDCGEQAAICRREKMHYSQRKRWDRIHKDLTALKLEISLCDYWHDQGQEID